MALEVKKQKRESNQGLIYRFARGMRRSGILLRKRRARFRARPKSDQVQKRAALRRVELKKEYEKSRKLGKND